jgi:hypothetical protein
MELSHFDVTEDGNVEGGSAERQIYVTFTSVFEEFTVSASELITESIFVK